MARLLRFVFLLALLTHLSLASYTFSAAERTELRELFVKCDGSNWKDNSGWLSYDDPCKWAGVSCSTSTYDVDLSDNGLVCDLTGFSLNLVGIKKLDLHRNSISGSLLMPAKELAYLEFVDLSDNEFSGPVPDAFFTVYKSVSEMFINHNHLTGPLSPSLKQMISLRKFACANNKLEGSLPSLVDLDVLSVLDVHDNAFTGTLPQLPRSLLAKGAKVDFGDNMFHCPKPVIAGGSADNDPYASATCTCPKGSIGNALGCQACPPGTASSEYFSTQCTACKETEYAVGPGATLCQPCPVFMYAPAGAARCTVSGSVSWLAFMFLLLTALLTMIQLKRHDERTWKDSRGTSIVEGYRPDNAQPLLGGDVDGGVGDPFVIVDDDDDDDDDDDLDSSLMGTVGRVSSMVVDTVAHAATELVQAAGGLNRIKGQANEPVPLRVDSPLLPESTETTANEEGSSSSGSTGGDNDSNSNTPVSMRQGLMGPGQQDGWAKDSIGVFNLPQESEDYVDDYNEEDDEAELIPGMRPVPVDMPHIAHNNGNKGIGTSTSNTTTTTTTGGTVASAPPAGTSLLPDDDTDEDDDGDDGSSFDLLPNESDSSDVGEDDSAMDSSTVHFPTDNGGDEGQDDDEPVTLPSVDLDGGAR